MYTLQSQITADLPPQFLLQALDDNADGVADLGLFEQLAANIALEINSTLGQRYSTPFGGHIPALVTQSSRVLLLEALYLRRGISGESNPWTARAQATRDKLSRIANGQEPLEPEIQRSAPSVTIIDEPSPTHSALGRFAL